MLCLVFEGCARRQKKVNYIIGFSQCVTTSWRKAMLEEMKRELSFHNDVQFIVSDAGNNNEKQVQQVNSMIDQGIDLLIISPNEAAPLTPIIEETFSRGIPVIVIDRKPASNLYTASVGADNYQIGKMAAEYIGEMFKNPASILEVTGLSGSSSAIERSRGFIDGLKKFPQIKIAGLVHGNWLQDKAKYEVKRKLIDIGHVDAIFAQNDMMAHGARQALNELSMRNSVKVVGVDALPGKGAGLEMISNKIIDASLLYPTGGKEAIETAFRILNKQPFLKTDILPTMVIDSSNVGMMKMQWDKIINQQKDIERQQNLITAQQKTYDNQRFALDVMISAFMLTALSVCVALYSLREKKKINNRLTQKNAEIVEKQNQLLALSAKAKEASEAKFNFFTNISHEFRTPLTLILSPLEDMLGNARQKAVGGKNLILIHKNVTRLLKLVNQLIDYRKIEYDKMKIKASPVDLIAFVRDIMEAFRSVAIKKGIDLRLISDEKELIVWFDVNMLDKVIFNLLSNAFNFTDAEGRIYAEIKKNGANALINVSDTGIGMSAECAAHIFELFYQGDERSKKGSGLGLALSNELIQLHHGNIRVNTHELSGTTFTVTLPLGDAHLSEDEKLTIPVTGEVNYDLAEMFTNELDEEQMPEENAGYLSNNEHSLLIIEDNADMLEYLAMKFAGDYNVYTAENAEKGLALAIAHIPDLIISDIVLHKLSGVDLSMKLKSDVRTSHIPVILLSARGSVEQQIEGVKHLADLYVTKPFNFDYLLENVKSLINNRILLKEHFISRSPAENKSNMFSRVDKQFLNQFYSLIDENISNENFNADDLGKLMGLSRVHLYRKVKALLGYSIADFILMKRLNKAKNLLLHENYSISEIAAKVGFSSLAYFSTAFKKKYELTPTEFKRKAQTMENQHG